MNGEVALGNEVVLVNGTVLLQATFCVARLPDEIQPEVSVSLLELEATTTIIGAKVMIVPDTDYLGLFGEL